MKTSQAADDRDPSTPRDAVRLLEAAEECRPDLEAS